METGSGGKFLLDITILSEIEYRLFFVIVENPHRPNRAVSVQRTE